MLDIFKKIAIILPCLAYLQSTKTCDPGQEPDRNGGCRECLPGHFNTNHNRVDSSFADCIAWAKCNEEGQYILTEGSIYKDRQCWCNETAGYGPKRPKRCYEGGSVQTGELEEACQCRKCKREGDCPLLRDKNGNLLEELTLDVGHESIGLNSCRPCSGVPVTQVVPPTTKPVTSSVPLPTNSSDVTDHTEIAAASTPKEKTNYSVVIGVLVAVVGVVAIIAVMIVIWKRSGNSCHVTMCNCVKGNIQNSHQYDPVSWSSSGNYQNGHTSGLEREMSLIENGQNGHVNGLPRREQLQNGALEREGAQMQGDDNPAPPVRYKYDLFLVHSSEDEEEVLELAERLEEEHGIKCCYADRDFQLGKRVMNNVEDLFKECRHIALCLTRNYLASSWCQHEQSMALGKATENGGQGMIPLLFSGFPESDVPPTLKAYSYFKLTSDPQSLTQLARHIKG
ncbi:uncharacterized protein LOC106168180 [Lingula anatina]|uniref:Uncharacterized protein LOC106168180 n=1 Tax=Lingula anatina TaxID=7574 RepID=A0A1S3IYH1_LINAN|nr:uncharacterized protein LOC106168180 [Lingula anatina]XP_013402595.1 uncharacterized protein LOC106168180 [Lingula anatina]XP_013402596.1 uncharacterized protein LOC106168180 [Lingula anatina]|eukprot:XP_013402594.1 uncharacterized protein LOC106168180 [Lingula anatina]